jgi:hypothetical protein
MSSTAQILANQQNCQLSTGPVSETGKAAVSLNALSHGLSGSRFILLASENRDEYEALATALQAEHNPTTATELILVEALAQHHWLARRALALQQLCFDPETGICTDEKQLAVYLRYQTTHQRAFQKSLNDLLKLRAEKRKAEIGFVSQKQREHREAEQSELTQARTRLANAKAEQIEIDSEVRQTVQAPLPGHTRVPFEDLCGAFQHVMRRVNQEFKAELQQKKAA